MSYPHLTTPVPTAHELAKQADDDARLHIQQRARHIQRKIVDACENYVDQLTQSQSSRALAVADARRQYANMLHACEVCEKAACRRTHSCQGEPADCLRVLLPAIGLDKAAHLIAQRRRPNRGRKGQP